MGEGGGSFSLAKTPVNSLPFIKTTIVTIRSLWSALQLAHVSGIEIYAPSEVEAVNGTTVKLKCTFRSSHPVSTQSVISR
uniref:Uncharacterized protein n=1 Tax=Hippocampus comes TaxID=109280 RepID=A0A3Q2YAT8_HIPCM